MKNKARILVVALMSLVAITSCKKEDIKPNEAEQVEAPKDCNCDRVIDVTTTFTFQEGSKIGNYTTKNDCTGFMEKKDWNSLDGSIPYMNECK